MAMSLARVVALGIISGFQTQVGSGARIKPTAFMRQQNPDKWIPEPVPDELLKEWIRPPANCQEAPERAQHFPALTCSSLEVSAGNSTVFVALADPSRMHLLCPWVENLRSLGLKPFAAVFGHAGVVHCQNAENAGIGLVMDFVFSEDAALTEVKLVHQLVHMNVDFVVSDMTRRFHQNPLQYFAQHADADLLLSNPESTRQCGCSQESCTIQNAFNASVDAGRTTGTLFLRGSSDGNKEFSKEWLRVVQTKKNQTSYPPVDILTTQWQYNHGKHKQGLKASLYYLLEDTRDGPDLRSGSVIWGFLPTSLVQCPDEKIGQQVLV